MLSAAQAQRRRCFCESMAQSKVIGFATRCQGNGQEHEQDQDQQVGMGDIRNRLEGLFTGDPKLTWRSLNLMPHVCVSRA